MKLFKKSRLNLQLTFLLDKLSISGILYQKKSSLQQVQPTELKLDDLELLVSFKIWTRTKVIFSYILMISHVLVGYHNLRGKLPSADVRDNLQVFVVKLF